MTDQRRPFGLCMYGVLWAVGRIGAGTSIENPTPLDADGLLEQADRHRLQWLELSPHFVSPELDPGELAAYRERADELGIRIVVAGPSLKDTDAVRRHIAACGPLGSPVLRCTMSGLLEGNRAPLGGYQGWRDYVGTVVTSLRTLLPELRNAGVTLGIENHQDADSETLLEICRELGPGVGVTLDAGNPLAVGEDPVEFTRILREHIVDIHLKDYALTRTPEGYLLTHCAIGDGVVDFAGIWEVLEPAPDLPRSIEMASWNARHIRLLTNEWWQGYGPRDVRTLVPVMRIRDRLGKDADDWRTPLESGTGDAEAWENKRLLRSIANLDKLLAAGGVDGR